MTARKHPPRGHPRARVPSIAFLALGGRTPLGPLLVENLSAGGALLTGEIRALDATATDGVGIGRSVIVQLRLPNVPHWLHVRAMIVREAPGSRRKTDTFSFAVRFRELSAEDEDTIQTSVLDALEEEGELASSAVIVFDDCADDRTLLGGLFVELRQRVIDADTFLELLRLLEDPVIDVHTVLVDVAVRASSALAVLAFLRDRFPNVRRVLMGGVAVERELAQVVSAGLAHAIIVKPSSGEALARVMAIPVR